MVVKLCHLSSKPSLEKETQPTSWTYSPANLTGFDLVFRTHQYLSQFLQVSKSRALPVRREAEIGLVILSGLSEALSPAWEQPLQLSHSWLMGSITCH